MEKKASVSLRRRENGEVVGQIVDETGRVLETGYFGKHTAEEFRRLSKVLNRDMSKPDTLDIELN